jgi:hypothetical protein
MIFACIHSPLPSNTKVQSHSFGLPAPPPYHSRAQGPAEQAAVIRTHNLVTLIQISQFEIPHDADKNSLQLRACKLLANAAMSPSAKGEVRRRRALA